MTKIGCQGRLRVLHVTRSLDMGGQEKLLVEFARWADRSRFDLHFVSLTGAGKLGKAISDLGWSVTTLEEPEGLRPGLVWRLARCLRALVPDVVHTHDDKPLIYGAGAVQLTGVPVLIHTKHYAWLDQNTSRRLLLMNLAARLARRIVCVSRDSARAAVAQGLPASKVTTIWNGIDLSRFAYTGPDPGGPVVMVARLSPEKDLATLLRATARALQNEPAFRLEIAGEGPCRTELEQLAGELHLGKNVRFLGEVNDIPALLSQARLFVLSSLTEGISLTLLEAMARGLPVAATQVGGNPEVVVAHKTGLLVPTRDAAALADAMLRLWRDPAEARRLGLAGRERVQEYFDIRCMVANYEDLYHHACRRQSNLARRRSPCMS